ncbi:MAG: SH3 domain-containing protein [Leptolyngbya sp.]|nr:SH3 domain-containing protein [Leptolyngbya sp.]
MKGFLNGLSKLLVGIVIALALLSLAGVATARYFMARLAVPPPKPLYGSELPAPPSPEPTAEAPVAASPAAAELAAELAAETAPAAEPVATNPTPAPATEALPPGSYPAFVSQPIGLIIRSGPGTEHGQVGSVDYNTEVVVLEEPAGQDWIKVRVVASGAEGWVKAGNTRRRD